MGTKFPWWDPHDNASKSWLQNLFNMAVDLIAELLNEHGSMFSFVSVMLWICTNLNLSRNILKSLCK